MTLTDTDMKIVKEYRLVCVDTTNNHSKVWIGRLYDDGRVMSEYGRVGANLQSSELGTGESLLESKKREKEKKGYKEIKTIAAPSSSGTIQKTANKNLEDIAVRDIAKDCKETIKLVKDLVQANKHSIEAASGGKVCVNTSGLVTTSTGDILSEEAVNSAKDILVKMEPLVAKENFGSKAFANYIEEYLMLVPQKVGHQKGWHKEFFNPNNNIQSQLEFLDQLTKSIELYKDLENKATSKSKDKKDDKVFDFGISHVTDSNILNLLVDLHNKTRSKIHHCYGMKIKNVFEISAAAQKERFESHCKSLDNKMQLFHGSGQGNWLSILSKGLKMSPPATAHISGKAFGNGIYFANCSTKSLNYSTGYWGGGRDGRTFLTVNMVALGNYQVPSGTTSKKPDSGYNSYWAKVGKTGYIQNDEIIIFNENQYYPEYLVEFE